MPALDAGLFAPAQAIEHYEISRHGEFGHVDREFGYQEAELLGGAPALQLVEENRTVQFRPALFNFLPITAQHSVR
jgi:ferritin-like metal-binding protein YciE